MGNQTTVKHSRPLNAAGTDGKTTVNRPRGTGHPGRPLGNHDEKRAELLDAAIAVTVEEGYARASMRRVAQRAGCTTGAVTYYFSNKEELGVAIAHNLFDRFEELLSASENQDDLGLLVEKWFDWAKSDKADLWLALFQLLAHAKQEPAFAEIVERRYIMFREMLTSKLAHGQFQGTVRRDIPAPALADQSNDRRLDGIDANRSGPIYRRGCTSVEGVLDRSVTPPPVRLPALAQSIGIDASSCRNRP